MTPGSFTVSAGAHTSNEDILALVHQTAQTVAVIDTKLDVYIERDKERKEEVEAMRGEMSELKVKVYTMAAIFSIVVSVATSWISNQIS